MRSRRVRGGATAAGRGEGKGQALPGHDAQPAGTRGGNSCGGAEGEGGEGREQHYLGLQGSVWGEGSGREHKRQPQNHEGPAHLTWPSGRSRTQRPAPKLRGRAAPWAAPGRPQGAAAWPAWPRAGSARPRSQPGQGKEAEFISQLEAGRHQNNTKQIEDTPHPHLPAPPIAPPRFYCHSPARASHRPAAPLPPTMRQNMAASSGS